MKTVSQQPTNKDLFKAGSYLLAAFIVPLLLFAGNDLINWVMKLIFKV